MGNWFGRKKPQSRVTEQDKAVLQLKSQRDQLKQYQKKINIQLEHDRVVAKTLLSENKKEKALTLLRKKKYLESVLTKTDGQLENIERMIGDIEFAQIETQVVRSLDQGNKALKVLHQFLSLDRVEAIMDETREAQEYQREIDSLLSGGLTADEERAVEDELEELLQLNLPEPVTDELPEREKPAVARSGASGERSETHHAPRVALTA